MNYLAAESLKSLDEVIAETAGVIVAHFGQAVSLCGLEILACVVGENRALERIKEADAEVVVVALRNLGVCAGYADSRDLSLGEDVAGCDGNGGTVGAEHNRNVRGNKCICSGRSLVC